VQELLAEGAVGRTYSSHISYVHGGGRGAVASWRLDGARSNGILGDLGSHLIDLARWLHGEIRSVSASVKSFGARRGADGQWVMPANDAATLLMDYASGAQGMIHTSAMAHVGRRGLEQHIVVHGAEGTLEADFTFGNFGGAGEAMAVRAIKEGGDEFVPLPIPAHIWGGVDPQTPMEVFNQQSAGDRYFIDAILNDLPIAPDFHDGAAAAAVVDAALESQRTGQRVDVGGEAEPN
jgi:predicted dehydrogenase